MKLADIAEALGCALSGDGNVEITGVAGIEEAGPSDLTFVSNPKYVRAARSTGAGAIIVSTDFESVRPPSLRTPNPYLAFARAIELFHGDPAPTGMRDPTAVIAATAKLGENCSIGPYAVVEPDAIIGDGAVLGPFTFVGRGVRAGRNLRTHSHVSIREHTVVGDNVILQDGARVGADGFGYARKDDGSWQKIFQAGVVVIEDDVEIGANATIDRATIGETRIRRGAKIDNLVQVGHASVVGTDTLLCAQVGLSGSTRVGNNCILAGQVGVPGHLTIGNGVVATGQTGVVGDVEDGRMISGSPSIDNRNWLRSSTLFRRLPELLRRIEALERRS
jgi:UDP-3-O-[3-hydroxymyristoyl] glucosamine N-acyltransferase